MNNNRTLFPMLCLCLPLLCFTASTGNAAESSDSESWEFAGELFGLGARVDGTTSAGEDIDVPLHDLLDNLDFAFMGTLAARKGKWTLFADLIYVKVGEQATIPLDAPQPLEADLDFDMKQVISTFGAGYQVAETQSTDISLLAGGRYLKMDADLKYDIRPLYSGRESESGSNWDFIVGARGQTNLSDQWYIHYYADIGTGDSDLTWQALAGINYRFTKVHLTLGYAYMDWEFDKDSMLKDFTLSGPYAGIKFRF